MAGPARRAGRPRNPVSRDHLIAVARAAFAEAGYSGASMSDIAARAGIRKASLFHHFRSKEALYLEMLAAITRDLADLLVAADLSTGAFLDRLDRLGVLVVRYLGSHGRAARLAMRELVDGGPFSAGPGRARVDLATRAVAAFLRSGMEEGAIAEQDPRQLAVSIIGLHLFHFAAADVTGALFADEVCSPAAVEARAEAVLAQVRRLCGARSD
jgi:TetR/AcrR family transcriptional regulator